MQKKELENLLKRLQADFDNYRKRVEQEHSEIRKSANADLILSLLGVLDNFKRALAHRSLGEGGADDSWTIGIKAIEKQFEDVLNQTGLETIEVKPGDAVNLQIHEIISQESTQGIPEGTIARELTPGYRLNGKVLRPAKVVVA